MEFFLLIGLGIGILFRYLWGALCRNVAEDKGYSGTAWFWWGFFFNVPALLIICIIKTRDSHYYQMKTINTLRKYKRKLDSGAITPEEFERKKAELLNFNTPAYTYSPPPSYNYRDSISSVSSGNNIINIINGSNGKTWVCSGCGKENPLAVRSCRECGRENTAHIK